MLKHVKKSIEKFRFNWKSYVLQCALATLAVFIIFLILNLRQAVIIASLGATAFIIFAMPNYLTAKSRNVIGGHIIGVLCGSLFAGLEGVFFIHTAVTYSLAVGLSIFLMVVTDTEHPPASGTALGLAMTGFSVNVVLTVLLSAVTLSLIRHFLKPYLKDL